MSASNAVSGWCPKSLTHFLLLDSSKLIPSATCPSESVLPIRLRPDFPVVFEGYVGGAEHWPLRQVARKRSLEADILRTS